MSSKMIRNEQELELMRQSGKITAQALKKTIESAKIGVSLLELERVATEEIKRLGGQSSFQTVPGYLFTTCLNINEEVVHGIPRPINLKKGDVLKIDLGALFKGWHTDSAWTVVVGEEIDATVKKFLSVGEEAMWKAIKQAKAGNRVGDISSAMQSTIEAAGFNVVKSLAGHGVGREPHEDPEIPEYGNPGKGMVLEKGMTLAIEAIYTSGPDEMETLDDGWTIAGQKDTLAGLFEMTIIVREGEPEILTDCRKV